MCLNRQLLTICAFFPVFISYKTLEIMVNEHVLVIEHSIAFFTAVMNLWFLF